MSEEEEEEEEEEDDDGSEVVGGIGECRGGVVPGALCVCVCVSTHVGCDNISVVGQCSFFINSGSTWFA